MRILDHPRPAVPASLLLGLGILACRGSGPTGPTPPPASRTGSLEITAVTTGRDLDPDGYLVMLDGSTSGQSLDANGSLTVTGLDEGNHVLELAGVRANCRLSGDSLRTIPVSADATATAEFDVRCEHALIDRILFDSGRDGGQDIYAQSVDGSDVVRLTVGSATNDNFQAALSPDGTRVAFTSDRDGNFEIYVMDADGSNQVDLTNDPSADQWPTWSPDGTRIAFVSNRDGNTEIYVMDADGSNQVDLTNDPGIDFDPGWSPDGSRIAFISGRTGGGDIYVMNADGSDPVLLAGDPTRGEQWPRWSPDGSRIAFQTNRDGDLEIYVVNADGSDPLRLTATAGRDLYPSWSPDGTRIAFTSDRNGDEEIFVMNADGSDPVDFTNEPSTFDEFPSWSRLR